MDEDLDATQLDEELIDPESDSSLPAAAAAAAAPSAAAPAQQNAGTGPVASGSAAPQANAFDPQTGQTSSGSLQDGQNDPGMLDRIRPSDMPDEGLVALSILDSRLQSRTTGGVIGWSIGRREKKVACQYRDRFYQAVDGVDDTLGSIAPNIATYKGPLPYPLSLAFLPLYRSFAVRETTF